MKGPKMELPCAVLHVDYISNLRNIIMTNEVKNMTLERSQHTWSGALLIHVNTPDRMSAPPHMTVLHSLSLLLGASLFFFNTLQLYWSDRWLGSWLFKLSKRFYNLKSVSESIAKLSNSLAQKKSKSLSYPLASPWLPPRRHGFVDEVEILDQKLNDTVVIFARVDLSLRCQVFWCLFF